ncbi:MAG TPA: sigma-70 family RNA polymerase sigma factor [Acidimicrobiales bacterium]|nr:sigma-70 family RNA polymerase sigma factor [Acidimicrobiales bacterium]
MTTMTPVRRRPSSRDASRDLPSAELARAAQGGDGRAIEELYRRTAPRSRTAARCYCGPSDAEDAASEGFIRALARLHQLRDPAAVEAWIVRCAVRAAIDVSRRQRRQQPNSAAVELIHAIGPPGESAAERALSAFERHTLAAALEQLPQGDRRLLRLRYEAGWSVRQISARLGLPEGTIRRRCFEACQIAGQRFLRGQLQPASGECGASTDQLCRAVQRGLSALARRRLTDHLRRCAACRSRERELAELTGAHTTALLG